MTDWQLGLIDSAWFGSELEGLPGLQKAREIGFDTVDLFIGFDPGAPDSVERQQLIENVRTVGLPVTSLVCTCLGLADFNPAARSYHIARAKSVLDLAADIGGVSNLLFVPGEYIFQAKLLPRSVEWEAVVDATRQVGEHAATLGLELAIELLPFEFAFVNSVDRLVALMDEVGLENVKAAVDVSHLWLIRADPSEIRKLEGRVSHVHLADCDGENHGDLPPGRGTTPFAAYLEVLRDIGFTGGASVELEFPPQPDQMLAWVEEAYRTSEDLLAEAGVRPTREDAHGQ